MCSVEQPVLKLSQLTQRLLSVEVAFRKIHNLNGRIDQLGIFLFDPHIIVHRMDDHATYALLQLKTTKDVSLSNPLPFKKTAFSNML